MPTGSLLLMRAASGGSQRGPVPAGCHRVVA